MFDYQMQEFNTYKSIAENKENVQIEKIEISYFLNGGNLLGTVVKLLSFIRGFLGFVGWGWPWSFLIEFITVTIPLSGLVIVTFHEGRKFN